LRAATAAGGANWTSSRATVTQWCSWRSRHGYAFGQAAESVGFIKRRRMARLAMGYVTRHRLANRPCRFDVVSIHFDEARPVIEVFQNAFSMDSR
jgi:Holliday junction resolvase-like predicted endonuclease